MTDADRAALKAKRDERFYIGMNAAHKSGGGWRQCRYCRGYADAGKGEIPPVKHVSPCPVGELEALIAAGLSEAPAPQEKK